MARNPGPGICVHCGRHVLSRNWDHVFPKAWYPITTPTDLAKWKIPSCLPCNKRHGENEEDLLRRICLTLDGNTAPAAGVPERASRAWQPAMARDGRDREARIAVRQRLIESLTTAAPEGQGVLPNFGAHDSNGSSAIVIRIHPDSLKMLARKIVRGLTYINDNVILSPDESIPVFFCEDKPFLDLLRKVRRSGEVFTCGPGIVVSRSTADDSPAVSIWHIEVFSRLKMWAVVGFADTDDPQHR